MSFHDQLAGLLDSARGGVSAPTPPVEPLPEQPAPSPDEAYNPADHTVSEVRSYVEQNPDLAGAILDAEEARGDDARRTLIDWLHHHVT